MAPQVILWCMIVQANCRVQTPPGSGQSSFQHCCADTAVTLRVIDASSVTPRRWIEESAELAKQYAYAPPLSLGRNIILLTREYETNARNIARSQAAARLANLVNNAL